MPKIREVDILLSENKNAKSQIRDIHPEYVFMLSLAILWNIQKRKQKGYSERQDILKKISPSSDLKP